MLPRVRQLVRLSLLFVAALLRCAVLLHRAARARRC